MGQKPELRGASQNAIPYNVGANLKTEMKPKKCQSTLYTENYVLNECRPPLEIPVYIAKYGIFALFGEFLFYSI